MIRLLTKFLRPDAPAPVQNGPISVAALLVRVARADHEYTGVERDMIDRFLSMRFGLDAAQAAALRAQGEQQEETAGDTVHLTRIVKVVVPLDDRPELLVQMWQIILSDDERHDDENGLMRLVCNLLGLADRDSALARQRAAQIGQP
jgi:uncharacterized tellurite resistance protein B-like protein